MKKINCSYARFAAWDGTIPVYECVNSASRHRNAIASDSACAGCKERVPISREHPPIIEPQKEAKQITLKEYMNATA